MKEFWILEYRDDSDALSADVFDRKPDFIYSEQCFHVREVSPDYDKAMQDLVDAVNASCGELEMKFKNGSDGAECCIKLRAALAKYEKFKK